VSSNVSWRRLWISSVLCFAVAFAAGYWWGAGLIPRDFLPESIRGPGQMGMGVGNVVAPDATFTYIISYSECDDIEEIQETAGAYLAGMTEDEVAQAFPDWMILYFSPKQVTLAKEVGGMCEEHLLYRSIGIKDGIVTVYYGKKPDPGMVHTVTGIPVSRLLSNDRALLQAGIVVMGDEAVAEFLEGLSE